MDNSWLITWDDTVICIDPWLTGTEIDGFSWFNEQWHVTPPVDVKDVPTPDLVIITQGYHDHCHPETLRLLGNNYPIAAIPSAVSKLKNKITNSLFTIPLLNKDVLNVNDLRISRIVPDSFIKTFNAVVIQKNDEYIFLAPHGCYIKPTSYTDLNNLTCRLLVTTFTLYQLPFWLGGKINPGAEAAYYLTDRLKPLHVVNTHDEDKHAKGISNKIARRKYPDFVNMPEGFTLINDYHSYKL